MKEILAQLPDIEDIALPEPVLNPWIKIGIISVGVILFAALTILVFKIIQKTRKSTKPQIPPRQLALQRFDQLAATASDRSPNEFTREVSSVLKDFLEVRHQDRLQYETAQEFIERLSVAESSSVPMSKRTQLAEFVTISEEIKFGLPPDAEARKLPLLAQAREIVAS